MHATRAAVYYLPHLDSPALRKRKLRIFIDDDGLADGDTHHYQLTRAFRSIGAACLLDDEEFGELGELCHYLEAETADFVRLAPKLYSRSLGAWCTVEMLSVDWMRALADALSVHFPHFRHEPYFEECFSQHVEERHAAEALEMTQMVLRARPELLDETLRDARIIAEALDGVWAHLDRIVRDAQATMVPARRHQGSTPARHPRSGSSHGRGCHIAVGDRHSSQRDLLNRDLQPRNHLLLEPAHFCERILEVGALEIDIDGADPEIAQGLQIGDNVGGAA